jgi:hypothetical protein
MISHLHCICTLRDKIISIAKQNLVCVVAKIDILGSNNYTQMLCYHDIQSGLSTSSCELLWYGSCTNNNKPLGVRLE